MMRLDPHGRAHACEDAALMGSGRPSRRSLLGLLASASAFVALPAGAQAPAPGPQKSFGYDDVVARARQLGERPFDADAATIPAELARLTYDSYREIRFRRDKAFWRDGGSDFRLLPFHLGFLHDKPVQLHIISHGAAMPIPFITSLFEYGKVPVPKGLSPSLGFAGFAVTTNLNDPRVQDEVISFLGASYFRLIGRGHHYGLSARSLAIDIGGAQPEEFPFMRALWLEEPSRDSTALTIYALLDSPSVAGAYRYVVRPGATTHVDVTATIFPRKAIERIGIAPLTSMFQAGEGDLAQRSDFRPEIHDSDGLMMQADERFVESYLAAFPGYYNTSDAGFIDADGYVFIMGRTDDIINVAGHRLSTGGMEEVLASHPAVAECAVVGIRDALKGEQPCGFVVLKSGITQSPDAVERELVALVREKIGPVAAFRLALTVGRLPKTRSGKILRATMKKIADGEDYAMPATIEDPAVLDEIGLALKAKGLG